MNLIKDIRLFEDLDENIDGKSLPSYIGKIYNFNDSEISTYILRLIFLLRYNQFSLGDFDHLYINFTPLNEHENILKAKRSIDKEFNWLRFIDVGCDVDKFNSWSHEMKNQFIINIIRKSLNIYSNKDLENCFKDMLDEKIHLPYKEKSKDEYLIRIMVRIISYSKFIPIIKVYKNNKLNKEIVLEEMNKDKFIMQFSTIVINKKTFIIKPRINSLSKLFNVKPIKYNFEFN